MKPTTKINQQNDNFCSLCNCKVSVLTVPPRGILSQEEASEPLAEIMALDSFGVAHYLCITCAYEVYNVATTDTGPTAAEARTVFASHGLQPPPWLTDDLGLWYRDLYDTKPWRCGACGEVYLAEWYLDGAAPIASPSIREQYPEWEFEVSLCDSCAKFLPHPFEIEPEDFAYVAYRVRNGDLLPSNPDE